MPGFFASNCLIASSTKVRFGTSAAQWLQKVNSLTCCALAVLAQQTTGMVAANNNERLLARTSFLQHCQAPTADLD